MNEILWTPSDATIRKANLTRFLQSLPQRFDSYPELHRWSVEHAGEFWTAIWKFASVIGERGSTSLQEGRHFTQAEWFPASKLNFAYNLLNATTDEAEGPTQSDWANPAIIALNERGQRRVLSRRELMERCTAFASWLQEIGIRPGDRVAAVLPNIPEAIIAMLGAAAIGAVWSSCSPEFGEDAICDRFGQIEPSVFVTTTTTVYSGKSLDLKSRVKNLQERLPSVKHLVMVGADGFDLSFEELSRQFPGPFIFRPIPFNHPLAILYSSGTTGAPKCIVHGAGGTLLQHLKEHQLHCDIMPGDRVFYYTTTGWMMWNWLVSALASKATIILYDGSPLYPDSETLWRLAAEERVTHFGASAKYFAAMEKVGITPGKSYDLSSLRVVMSTGSPLLPESFDYIYREVKEDVCLASISGGTDIISCFALGCPILPVRRGELQAKGLGMDVKIFNDEGQAIIGEPGELVCTSPFPSMPIAFWNDPDGAKYRAAYFERFDNIWCHGDWAEETANGGIIIHGRSDATLNPGGVRIGTAEIYQQVEAFPEVAEALATAFRREGDEKIVLFLRIKPDHVLTPELIAAIKQRLRTRCSPRHVPHYVIAAPDFPRTISGKLSEIAVRNAIHSQPIRNLAALANPESLDFFQTLREFQPPPPRA